MESLMTKSSDAKSSAQSASTAQSRAALLKAVQEYNSRAAAAMALDPSAAEELDPVAVQVRATAAAAQLVEAVGDGTPDLLWFNGERDFEWVSLLEHMTAESRTESTRQGARQKTPSVPKESQIGEAIANAAAVRRRVEQAIGSSKWEPARVAKLREHVLGGRKMVAAKARWDNELALIIKAIEDLGQAAPPALRGLLPKLRAAEAQVARSQPQPAGRAKAVAVYSAIAIEKAMALDLALDDLCAWAAATANDSRNGAILRTTSPKRQSDAKPAGEGKTGGEGTTGTTGAAGAAGAGGAADAGGMADASQGKAATAPMNGAPAPSKASADAR
jgi:hypothetical protein